jgi:hypothetical protein
MGWQEIGRWSVPTKDGGKEEYILEKKPLGNFRIKNDFGNIQIEMDQMAAYEFFKNIKEKIEQHADHDLTRHDSDKSFRQVPYSADDYDYDY